MASKLFLTFSTEESCAETIADIQSRYTILYSKIFVLESDETPELMITYNLDSGNLSDDSLFPGTILVHRKRETATLYTINSLNLLIASLNNGVVDRNFLIHWNDYRNCVLLTRQGGLARINTKIKQIISLK